MKNLELPSLGRHDTKMSTYYCNIKTNCNTMWNQISSSLPLTDYKLLYKLSSLSDLIDLPRVLHTKG
jgi:hypothetical protein